MRRLVAASLIILISALAPATAFGNGFERAMREILFGILLVPLILIGIAVACAIMVPQSRFALLYYPIIGGLIAAACVPPLISAKLSVEAFLGYGIVYGLAGLGIGGLACLIRAALEQHKAKAGGS